MEKQNKPAIRFKGFTDAWEQRKLGDNIVEYTEVTTENNQYPPLTSSRKGIFLQTEYFAGNQIASDDNTGYNIVPYGYFTYRHMSDDEVFHFNINDIVEKGIVSTLYPVFTTDENLDSRYLQYQLNYGHEFAKFAILQKQGGSRTYMYLNKLRQLHLTMPNHVEEQKAISSFFMNLDHLITLHQRKYDKLQVLKKAMLEKMFPKNGSSVPEIRFKGFTDAWEQRKVGEVSESYSGGTPSVGVKEYYGGQIPFIRSAEINSEITELFLTEEGLKNSSARLVAVGDILYALYGATSGEVGRARLKGAINQAILAIKPHTDYDSEYLAQWLRKSKHSIIDTYLQGGQGNLSGTIVKELSVDFPSLKEQKAIGGFFRQLDNLITLHQRELEKLQNIKKSMLEKMFV